MKLRGYVNTSEYRGCYMLFEQVLAECKRIARLNGADYAGYMEGYRADRYAINRDRLAVMKRFDGLARGKDIVVSVNRLDIGANELEFTACQYGAVEIYGALYRALEEYYK